MKAKVSASILMAGLVTAINAAPAIVPAPSRIRETKGEFTLSSQTNLIQVGSGKTASYAAREIEKFAGFRLRQSRAAGSSIVFAIDKDLKSLGKEGYRLSVQPDRVEITAPEEAGLFYGFQTFRQLLPTQAYSPTPVKGVKWTVPCVEIEDAPRFSWRGSMLDVSRHFMPKERVKRWLDLMAIHKQNTFHWHLTDDQGWRIEIKKYPKLTEVGGFRKETIIGRQPGRREDFRFDGTPHGGFYTQDDVREIVAYAAERHITIVPEIEMPGHAQAAIAAYPELGNLSTKLDVFTYWGVNPNVFNPSDQTIAFLKDVLDEVITLFPGEFIHVGGDECPKDQWKTSEVAQAQMKKHGLKDEHELQSWFIKQMDTHLEAKGRRLIGWDEILEGGLAPGATVMSWRGSEGGIAAAKAGHDVVMAPNTHCYLDYGQSRNTANEPVVIGGFLPLDKVYSFDPVPAGFSAEEAKRVLGAQGNLWTEYIRDSHKAEYMAFPRLIALAEVTWSERRNRDYDNFIERLGTHLQRLDEMQVNYRRLDDGVNPLLGVDVAGWKTGDLSNDFAVKTFPIQEGIKGAGSYRITFQYISGGHRCDIEWVELLLNGQVAARVDQLGITGLFDRDNVYRVDLKEIPAGAKIELRANMRGAGGGDSNGRIYIAPLPR